MNLEGSVCRGCSFRGSMLAWANLRSADFTGADFTHAILSESDFRGALLMHAGLTGTYLKPVIANPDQFLNRPGLVRGHDVTQKEHHGYQPLRLRNPPAGGAPVLRGTYYPAQRSQRDPEAGPSFFRPDRARPQTEVIVDFSALTGTCIPSSGCAACSTSMNYAISPATFYYFQARGFGPTPYRAGRGAHRAPVLWAVVGQSAGLRARKTMEPRPLGRLDHRT
ncbi:pentapeptide repeat-containing protein [Corynebacterium diphtheriae]